MLIVDAITFENPAGLIPVGETPEVAAIRELWVPNHIFYLCFSLFLCF